jgi:hypothetical protein
MIADNQIITIQEAKYIENYKISIIFNDNSNQLIDFYPFLSTSLNPHINKYLDINKFKNFEIHDGDLEWNDYDLCFPIADLYENNI